MPAASKKLLALGVPTFTVPSWLAEATWVEWGRNAAAVMFPVWPRQTTFALSLLPLALKICNNVPLSPVPPKAISEPSLL